MNSEEKDAVKALCLIIYECVGRSDEDFIEAGVIRIGLALGGGRVRDERAMIMALCALVTRARDKADSFMAVIDPDNQRGVVERANALMDAWNKGRATDEGRKAALDMCGVIDDNDLDIIKARKLIALATDARTPKPEALAAASAAAAIIVDRGLMLGPTRKESAP